MKPRTFVNFLLLPCCLTLLTGCQQPAHDMEAMQPPSRPAELDQLNEMIGHWQGAGDMTMYGPDGEKKMTTTGYENNKWMCDNRVLFSEMEYEMGEMGTIKGFWLATWDPRAKKFRTWWFDNYGTVSEGTMSKNPETGVWTMKGSGRDGMSGETTISKGTSKMIDANTIEWHFSEYDSWGIKKKMEGTGTSKRK